MTAPNLVSAGGPDSVLVRAVAVVLLRSRNERATIRALRQLGLSGDPKALLAALRLADHAGTAHKGTRHAPRVRGRGDAAREVARAELNFRAAYIVNANKRISEQLASGKRLAEALRQERSYYNAHEAARKRRQIVAAGVDAEAGVHGALLGWHAHPNDGRTTPECRAADGSNFTAGIMPKIGYPGGVHMYCRCSPGPPFNTARTVDESTLGITH